ncbi:YMGG-like glycine zipper-containing protein [Marichromatium gracile]|uniref:YMGG-like glycine zipper-containing protein n=1 Tax=Marichromatium gracile TaxID=1048 RepID=UPI00227923E5
MPIRLGAAALCLLASFLSVGCATQPGRATTGGALMGAATGAAIGSLSADAGKGALIGAGAGALGGYLIDAENASRRAPPSRYGPRPYQGQPCPPGLALGRGGRCVRY